MSKGRNHASRRLKAQQSTNQVLGNQPNTRRKQTESFKKLSGLMKQPVDIT